MALQPDGKIIVAVISFFGISATGGDFAVARYNTDGSPDATFGFGGTNASLIFGASLPIRVMFVRLMNGACVPAPGSVVLGDIRVLKLLGLGLSTAVLVDATIVPVPKQRNSREDNDTVKAGKTPEEALAAILRPRPIRARTGTIRRSFSSR